MRGLAFIIFATAMQVQSTFACPIEELRKIADDHLDRLPSNLEREFGEKGEGQDGGAFQMFEGEGGTPHSLVLTFLGETGQTKVRLSYLNRRDVVVVETEINYDYPDIEGNRSERFKVNSPRYSFFCDDEWQFSTGTSNIPETAERATHWKNYIAKSTGDMRLEFERIPE